jgi:hypothetical protein
MRHRCVAMMKVRQEKSVLPEASLNMADKLQNGNDEKGFSAFSGLVSDVAAEISNAVSASSPPQQTPKTIRQPADIDVGKPTDTGIQKHLRNRRVQSVLGVMVLVAIYVIVNRPGNFYECILDGMPGVRNNIAARQIMLNCRSKFPDAVISETKSSWGGSARDCVVKHGKSAGGEIGPNFIRRSCYALYPNE